MVRARFATPCWQMLFSNARSKVDSARHGPFTPLSSARRCLESELTLTTAYRILTGAQLRDKPLLNPREFGNQDDSRHGPSCLHPRLDLGTMVLPLVRISALATYSRDQVLTSSTIHPKVERALTFC